MKDNVLFGVLCVLAAAVAACSSGRDKTQSRALEFALTYAENQVGDCLTTQGVYKFAELVRERTRGRVEIQVNVKAVLGDEKAVIGQLQLDGVDFARISLSLLAEFVPELNVLQMPHSYTGREHMWRVLEGPIGNDFMNSSDGSNLVVLFWYDAGIRSFCNIGRPVETLGDMRGLSIRVQESRLMMDTIEALRATPTPTVFGGVYSGLQTGKIDGVESNWSFYESIKHYEMARYFTLDEHTRMPESQLAAQPTWDKFSPGHQDIIREYTQESAQYERQLWTAWEKVSGNIVRKTGCIVTEFSPEEKVRFQEAATPMYEKYCSGRVDIIDAIMEAGDNGG